ncbi:MAG: hypothetical protein EOO36_06380 [Cytophagaceae bacterium]|nr:MAG: hypothetical protein EOO36_06380 [Cytophagaceae bacterium]
MASTPSAPAPDSAAATTSKPLILNLLTMAVPPALNYARQWLDQEHVQALVENLPSQLEKTGAQALARFRKMSAVEKVASGLLLAIVVRQFLRHDD